MQELIASMMRFSAAITLFGMQQFQNVVGAAADTQAAMDKFREALDKVTDAVASEMDDAKKATLESVSKVQSDLVGRTFDAMNVQVMDPREVMQTTGDLMRKTTDSLAGIMQKAAGSKPASEQTH